MYHDYHIHQFHCHTIYATCHLHGTRLALDWYMLASFLTCYKASDKQVANKYKSKGGGGDCQNQVAFFLKLGTYKCIRINDYPDRWEVGPYSSHYLAYSTPLHPYVALH